MSQRIIARAAWLLVILALTSAPPVLAAPIVLDSNGAQDVNNLKRIAFALLDYNAVYQTLPGEFTGTAAMPLLSWRVALLPFVGETALYQQFDLTRAWDDPANMALLSQMPDVYRSPLDAAGSTITRYVGASGPGTMFEGAQGVKLFSASDGTTNTLLVGETEGTAIPWTAPQDISIGAIGSCSTLAGSGFSSFIPGATPFAFADASVGFFPNDLSCQTLAGLFIRNDGNADTSRRLGYVIGSPVPEPSTIALFGIGLLLMLVWQQRLGRPTIENRR